MYQQFKKHIENTIGNAADKKVLLAVSGGIDSVTMFHLCKKYFKEIAIAHCNFHLRGVESNMEAEFVIELGKKNGVKVFVKDCETEKYAQQNKLSVQVAARELRYSWFEKLLKDLSFDYIAIGHNRNDLVETFTFNLLRGSGIRGLTSMKALNGNILRPTLFASREEIERYALAQNLEYCNDSSNASVKYTRNKIRHNLFPLFKEINEQFEEHIINTVERLEDAQTIMHSIVKSNYNKLVKEEDNYTKIHIAHLLTLPGYKTILFELLESYGFSSSTITNVIESIQTEPGKIFKSESHELLRDRKYLLIQKISKPEDEIWIISDTQEKIENPLRLNLKIVPLEIFKLSKDSSVANFDYNKIQFPLIIRKWQQGDRFIPFGMKNFKKVSDFFIDEKIPIFEKEKTFILTDSNTAILWIIGRRIDDRFKITDKTKKIFQIQLL